MNVHERLKQAGLRLPELAPTKEFLRVKLIDDLAFVSGHAPFEGGDFRNILCNGVLQRGNASRIICALQGIEHAYPMESGYRQRV
jgi:hypothetical protein